MKLLVWVAVLFLAGTGMAAAQDRGYADEGPGDNSKIAWADVLRVDPVYDRVRGPAQQVCEDVPIERRSDNGNRAAGTVLGAIVGGVLGSTVGKGDGRRAATVAGAVAGGAIGNGVARGNDGYYDDVERHCRMVEGVAENRVVAYDVQYRYRGDVFMSRLDYDPGDRLRVRIDIQPAE